MVVSLGFGTGLGFFEFFLFLFFLFFWGGLGGGSTAVDSVIGR